MYRIKPYELNISDMSRHEDFDFILPIPLINYREASNTVDSVLDISCQKNQRFSQLTSNARPKSQGLMGSIESWVILWLCGRMCGVKADHQEGRILKMRRK